MKLSAWKTTKYIMKLSAKTQKKYYKGFARGLTNIFLRHYKSSLSQIFYKICVLKYFRKLT